ncbi:MAG: hypothetical protein QM724_02140 [Flavobacteriales bacterium]
MPNDKGYERMNELAAALQRALLELEAGRLDLDGLERSTDDARALYERLVVLRHKAREARQHPPAPAITTAPPLRLDTRPQEPGLRQTSLIDAIAETEAVPAKPEAAAPPVPEKAPPAPPKEPEKARPSLADKLEHAPVADLHKAIALSQKFWFVAELFAGKREAYEQAIDAINAARSFAEAKAYVDREITAKLNKPPDDEVLITFLELVQRRFS